MIIARAFKEDREKRSQNTPMKVNASGSMGSRNLYEALIVAAGTQAQIIGDT